MTVQLAHAYLVLFAFGFLASGARGTGSRCETARCCSNDTCKSNSKEVAERASKAISAGCLRGRGVTEDWSTYWLRSQLGDMLCERMRQKKID